MGFVSKIFNPSTPSMTAPPAPPDVNAAADAADARDKGLSQDDQTYNSTLLTGAASTTNAQTKKNVLLGGS